MFLSGSIIDAFHAIYVTHRKINVMLYSLLEGSASGEDCEGLECSPSNRVAYQMAWYSVAFSADNNDTSFKHLQIFNNRPEHMYKIMKTLPSYSFLSKENRFTNIKLRLTVTPGIFYIFLQRNVIEINKLFYFIRQLTRNNLMYSKA